MDAFEMSNIRPVVDDKVFSLEQAKEAFEYLVSFLVIARSSALLTVSEGRPETCRQGVHQDGLAFPLLRCSVECLGSGSRCSVCDRIVDLNKIAILMGKC